MKKILAAMLIISMTAGMTLQNVKASDEEIYYSESQIESIAQNYTENESLFEKCLWSDEGIAYWKMMHKINADHAFTWALDISSKMIEEYPDKKRYAEILSCLISMQTGNVVEQVSEQSRFDHLKDTEDITWNAMEIANELVGKKGVIGSINDIVGKIFDGTSTVIKSKEIAKYYETIFQDYAESTMFLDAIVSYSENSELKEVAGELKKASDSLLEKRLECLADISEEVAEYEAKIFYENLGVELLKQSDVYNTDDSVKFFADEAIKITENFSDAKLAFNVMIYAGNLAAGTNNTYNRYQEMKVVADISDALLKASEAVEVPNDTTADEVNALNEKCYYYKSLIVNHARGEYLVHQLLMKDAEGVSSFRWLQEYFSGNGMKTDEWYDSQIEVLVKCYDAINNIFQVDEVHDTIEVSDYLNSYDQLKELLAMQPVDYWQFPDSESYMVDDFYVEWKNNIFSMRNEGASYVTLYGTALGDSMTEVDQALTENGWVTYTESESGHSYLTLIEEELYYVELDADENGNLKDWYLNNWREGEDIAEVLKNLTGEKTDQEDAWKSVYLNYIETNTQIEDPEKGTHREIYKLLDLNEDGVPELYINFGSTAGGDAILSYFNGEIVEQKMDNYGFRYIEGANLFRDSGGHMDEYYDKIYTLENGNFVLLYSGEYGAEDNSKVEYGDDGMPVYQYFWENEEVSSEEEYDRKLNEVYDTEKEVNIFLDAQYDSGRGRYVGNGLCDYQEITEAIEAY
ncbi:hypothetical protein DXB71_05540 [Blautia sp. OM05-6]|uniref:hypothetical protein n=1 Tax=Blautia sp. OM05-6 TaxID=2292983 RepID=UPI000E4724E7|nr:hypothetical protein [Blautia sp. OM05-6]RHV26776.1 hypothetical protein DXB71_05540 [Blautia sp. OM05-6]